MSNHTISTVINAGRAAIESARNAADTAKLERRLYSGVNGGDAAEVQRLLDHGVNPLTPTVSELDTDKAFAPVHRALERRDVATAMILISATPKSALDTIEGRYGDTPLMMAVRFGQTSIAEALIMKGADPALQNAQGVSPFMEMCRRGNTDLAAIAIASQKPHSRVAPMMHAVDADGTPSLHLAIMGGGTEAAKHALIRMHESNGFDVNGKYGPEGYSAIHVACAMGDAGMIRHLVTAHKADVNSYSGREMVTPAMAAAWANQPDSIATLSNFPQTNLNARCAQDNSTALHLAAGHGHQEVAIKLASCGADLQAKNSSKQTPADLASYIGNFNMAKLLRDLDPHHKPAAAFTQIFGRVNRALNSIQELVRPAAPRP